MLGKKHIVNRADLIKRKLLLNCATNARFPIYYNESFNAYVEQRAYNIRHGFLRFVTDCLKR